MLGPWRDAAKEIRETAKWLVTIFGAIGAILIGTAPFTGVGELEGLDLLTAFIYALLVLVGIALVIWRVSNVLLPETTSLPEAISAASLSDFRTRIQEDPWSYLGTWAQDLEGFKARRELELTTLTNIDAKLSDPNIGVTVRPTLNSVRPAVKNRVENVEIATARLLTKATYHEVRTNFVKARRWMFVGSVISAIGIGGFLATVNAKPEKEPTSPENPVSLVRRGTVKLTAAGVERYGPLLGATCVANPIGILVVSGEETGPWRIVVDDRGGCKPSSFLLNKEEGVPISD